LILTEDIAKLGDAGDLVKVKPGYGRNYLLPRGLAQLATPGRVRELEHQKRVIEEKTKKAVGVLQGVAADVAKVSLEFQMQSNAEGKLFGSVGNADIAARLKELGHAVERRKIALDEPIKQVGEHIVKIRLHREVQVEIPVNVVSSGIAPEVLAEEELQSRADLAMDEAESLERADEDERH
jgi:large subunit ribosomal protein L9